MLFDEIERNETRLRRENESTFSYLNLSARAPMTAARQVLEQWFADYPDSGNVDLRARFRSPIDGQFKSAFWEIYLHELFSRVGFGLEPHPDIEASSNHPDFLVGSGDDPKFYLEAVVAGLPSMQDAGADARLATVIDLINEMEIPEWILRVEYRGSPETPPPLKELRRGLERWLASLDIKAIDASLRAQDWDNVPKFEWQRNGLSLTFTPSPKSSKATANPESQPIGVLMGEGGFVARDEDLRRAIKSKSKKYGRLALPLVVAVNVVSEPCDDIDINNALFGTEQFVYTLTPDGVGPERAERRRDGVWFGPKGPRNELVSGVLVGRNVEIYNCADDRKTPLLIHNPYSPGLLALEYALPQSIPDDATHRMKRKDGRHAREFLRLLDPWPPVYD